MRIITQADRIEGERQHAEVAPQAGVDRYYRLHPRDLGGAHAVPRLLRVRQAGMQGFEQPIPLLHLAGLTKPLLLDETNVAALTRIAGSPLQRDWEGREVVVAVELENGQQVIRLYAPADPSVVTLQRRRQNARRAQVAALRTRQLFRWVVVLLTVLVLAAAAYYVWQNREALLALATAFVNGMVNP